jgi:hypothetical protein
VTPGGRKHAQELVIMFGNERGHPSCSLWDPLVTCHFTCVVHLSWKEKKVKVFPRLDWCILVPRNVAVTTQERLLPYEFVYQAKVVHHIRPLKRSVSEVAVFRFLPLSLQMYYRAIIKGPTIIGLTAVLTSWVPITSAFMLWLAENEEFYPDGVTPVAFRLHGIHGT